MGNIEEKMGNIIGQMCKFIRGGSGQQRLQREKILTAELKKVLLEVTKYLQSGNRPAINLDNLQRVLSGNEKEFEQIKVAAKILQQKIDRLKTVHSNPHISIAYSRLVEVDPALRNFDSVIDFISTFLDRSRKNLIRDPAFVQQQAIQITLNGKALNVQCASQTANLKSQIAALKQLPRKLEDDIKSGNLRLARALNDIQKAQQQITGLKKQQSLLQRDYESRSNFKSSILQDSIEAKDYLIKELQILTKRPIRGAKLLFRQDSKYSPQDFHKAVDSNPNLLVLARTEHAIAAGYCSNTLDQSRRTQGCILELTNKQKYEMHKRFADQQCPAISYDPYSLTFGKGQLKIVLGSLQAHSNLGKVRDGMFDLRGQKVSSLFNEGSKTSVEMKSIEILQVIFEQK